METALIILAEGFEEIEAVTPIDLLLRADVDVTVASLGDNLMVNGRSGIHLTADYTLGTALKAEFDMIVLPGGPGHRFLRNSKRVLKVLQEQAARGGWIGAICAAPLVLNDAGLLQGKRYTAHCTAGNELKEIIEDEPVVVDGKIITSRGAGTAVKFSLACIKALKDEATAQQVAESIHFQQG